jgi:hypothetical protein
MEPEMLDTERPISSVDLDGLQRRLGVQLPDDYRAWLLRYNGGRPWPGAFHYKHEKGDYTGSQVAWFLAVYDGEAENFEMDYRFWKLTTRRVIGDLVPIAGDPFGNLICLSFGGPDAGKVYFWEMERETDPPSYANCHLVADSFPEFIDQLARDPKSFG